MTMNDGGPAFPSTIEVRTVDEGGNLLHADNYAARGMSLRDWFAGKALAALIAKFPLLTDTEGTHGEKRDLDELMQVGRDLAASAYEYADAMIAERAKGGDA